MYFDEELEFMNIHEDSKKEMNHKQKLTESEAAEIRSAHPNVPLDFVNYLIEIGAGNLRESSFKVYSNLCDFNDLGFEDVYELPENIKLFGDNYSGDFTGLDLSNSDDEVIEFWHDSHEIFNTGKTFRQYIREKMLMS